MRWSLKYLHTRKRELGEIRYLDNAAPLGLGRGSFVPKVWVSWISPCVHKKALNKY